ncbi:GAK5 protein, partial [Picathartes gymnocephalus]|nr:GAK5 protein [Picathartes gymnocephalus]
MAAAFAAMGSPSNTSGVCFGCGKPGHLKRHCPNQNKEKPKPTTLCPRCRKGFHFVNQCHSKYDVEGCLILENQNRSAGRPRTPTQIVQLQQQTPQTLTPQVPAPQVSQQQLP